MLRERMGHGANRLLPEGKAAMKLMDLLHKGFDYLLMSMGVSRPGTGTKPASKPAPPERKTGA